MKTVEEYLQKHKAWNWRWPDKRGRWYTKARKRGTLETYSGPSKKTLGKRAAKARRRKK